MTPELALQLGRAVTFVAGRGKTHAPRILIGKDTRLSGYMIETALAAGICSMGGRVMLCGPIPTPAVAHLTMSMRADAGIVISASHNPYDDNGIKIFGADGFKLPDEAEVEIEALMQDHAAPRPLPHRPRDRHAPSKLEDARGRYVVVRQEHLSRATCRWTACGMVVDAAHGAAYRVAPLVFQELGAKVTAHRREAQRRQHQPRTSARCIPRTSRQDVVQARRRHRHRPGRRRRPRHRGRREGRRWSTATR